MAQLWSNMLGMAPNVQETQNHYLAGTKRKHELPNGNAIEEDGDRGLPIAGKTLKLDPLERAPIAAETLVNLPPHHYPKFWLAIDFVTANCLEAKTSKTISKISAALGHVASKKCIGRWALSIKPPVHSPELDNRIANLDGDTKTYELEKALALLVSSVECLCGETIDPSEKALQLGDVVLVTDGHTGVRNGLHRDMVFCGVPQYITEHALWWSYLEIGQLVSEMQPSTDVQIVGLDQAILALNPPPASIQAAASVVDGLNSIVEQYLTQGLLLKNPQTISPEYIPMVLPEGCEVAPGTVVEVRQLPWTATPYTIASFFRGLNIIPGGIAIKIVDGRRSNTAYVCFQSPLDAQLACARDQTELASSFWSVNLELEDPSSVAKRGNETKRNRPTVLQVFPADEISFLQHSVCKLTDVANFLGQLYSEKQIVVRMRGLPYSTKKQHIVDFFNQVHASILNDTAGIYFVSYSDRRPTGDAFVIFIDDENANRALTRHRNYLGQRYVELFKASPSEQVQVCQSVSKNGSPNNTAREKVNRMLRSNALSMDPSLQFKFAPQINDGPSAATAAALQASLANQLFFPNMLSQPLLSHLTSLAAPISAYSNSVGSQGSADLPTPDSLYRAEGQYLVSDCLGNADLNDPIDSNSPFLRSVLQILDLPPSVMRHEMALYLGSVNFAKIRRMWKMVDCSSNGSWLLLLAELSESLQVIEYLIQKPFIVTSGLNLPSQSINPRFVLYEMNSQNQLAILPVDKLPSHIRNDRLINIHMHSQLQYTMNSPKIPCTLPSDRLMSMDVLNSNIQASGMSLDALRQLATQQKGVQPIGAPLNFAYTQLLNVADLSLTNPAIFLPRQQGIDFMGLTKRSSGVVGTNLPSLVPESNCLNAPSLNEASVLQVTGLPRNVTAAELISLYGPVAHLLSMQPQFIPLHMQENGTCTYLAVFASRADADLVTTHCPLGSLRDNTFITVMCPLWTPSLISRPPTMMPFLPALYQVR